MPIFCRGRERRSTVRRVLGTIAHRAGFVVASDALAFFDGTKVKRSRSFFSADPSKRAEPTLQLLRSIPTSHRWLRTGVPRSACSPSTSPGGTDHAQPADDIQAVSGRRWPEGKRGWATHPPPLRGKIPGDRRRSVRHFLPPVGCLSAPPPPLRSQLPGPKHRSHLGGSDV